MVQSFYVLMIMILIIYIVLKYCMFVILQDSTAV